MAHSGLGYYYNKAGLSSGDLSCWFNFNNSGNTNAQLGSGGLLFYGSTGSVWSSLGSGLFSGQSAEITGSQFSLNESTTILLYSKNITGNCVLFSSLRSGSSVSGFSITINDANKIQVSSYDSIENEFIVNTSDMSLARNNGLIITKADNIVNIGKFNFAEKSITSNAYSFPIGCNTESSSITIASGNWFPDGVTFNNFTGYLDELLIINRSLPDEVNSELFKSFYKYEPVNSFSVISENDSYSYSNLNTVTSPMWEELQSGALDYINSNIFNKTGIGTIRVVSSGTVINGTGYVSGSLSGQVSLQTGYYRSITGSGVTGFSSSGLVPSASGITGYIDIDLYPITVFNSGDIYQLSAQSGLIGATDWVSEFTDPLYGPIVTTELITGSEASNTLTNFSYIITGLSGNSTYTHIADYTNNGSDNIIIAHELNHSSIFGSFRAFKTTQILYQTSTIESSEDLSFKNLFKYDGVVLLNSIQSGDLLNLVEFDSSGSLGLNQSLYPDLVSGLFFINSPNTEHIDDSIFYQNGVFQNRDDKLSGIFSGEGYFLSGNFLNSDSFIDRKDFGIVDRALSINTISKVIEDSVYGSGLVFFSGLGSEANAFNNLIFLNGIKLCPTVDYNYISNRAGSVRWSNNNFSGTSGVLSLVLSSGTGNLSLTNREYSFNNSITGNINQNQSLLFYNRLKQKIGVDYLEISSLDLIYNLSGFYSTTLEEFFI